MLLHRLQRSRPYHVVFCYRSFYSKSRRSDDVELVTIPCRSNGEIILDIHHPSTSSRTSPIILYLPRGPIFKDEKLYTSNSSTTSTLATSCPAATVVQINYRLSHAHRFPAPIHDVLEGYDWVVRNLSSQGDEEDYSSSRYRSTQGPRVGVCGELVGGSLALMLAMTECRRSSPGRISAVAVGNAVVDWVFPEDFHLSSISTPSATSTTGKRSKHSSTITTTPQAPNPLSSSLLTNLRLHAFDSSKPSSYFDPFASPIHFLRSSSITCPPSTSSSTSPGTASELDAQFAALLSLDLPSELTEPPERRRKAPLRWPAASSLLIPPQMRIGVGAESVLRPQMEEFVGLLRRAIVKSDAGTSGVRQGRRVYGREEDDDEEDEDEGVIAEARAKAERLVGLEAGVGGSGLWCWEGGAGERAAGGKEEVKRVGEWFMQALQ